MKTLKFLNLLLIPLFGMISFSACSSDDDDPEQGSDDPKPEELKLKTFEENVNGVAFTMIAVPGGSFNMGTDEDIKLGSLNNDDEKPAHKVTLDSYYIGETEVTQALWQAVMGSNPSSFKGAQRPVENVTYKQCVQFTEKLSKLTGKAYTLPTEAQWEYAARGGQQSRVYHYAGSNNPDDVAWYLDNSGNVGGLYGYSDKELQKLTKNHRQTHPVKLKSPNELGIYDMSGNVWEWCQEESSPRHLYPNDPTSPILGYDAHKIRGGSCLRQSWESLIVCSSQGYNGTHEDIGLRLALTSKNK